MVKFLEPQHDGVITKYVLLRDCFVFFFSFTDHYPVITKPCTGTMV